MRLQIVIGIFALLLAVVVVEALRRRRLSEGWALLWIGVAIAALVLGLARPLVDRLSTSLGIAFGTSLVFAVAIVFLIVVCINLSMQVSRLNRRVEILAEELALASTDEPPSRPGGDGGAVDDGNPPDPDAPGAGSRRRA
jgi:hypothetical protein